MGERERGDESKWLYCNIVLLRRGHPRGAHFFDCVVFVAARSLKVAEQVELFGFFSETDL